MRVARYKQPRISAPIKGKENTSGRLRRFKKLGISLAWCNYTVARINGGMWDVVGGQWLFPTCELRDAAMAAMQGDEDGK